MKKPRTEQERTAKTIFLAAGVFVGLTIIGWLLAWITAIT